MCLPADDWHRHPDFGGIPRSEILKSTIKEAALEVETAK